MRVNEIIEEFDREVGPAVRTAVFSVLLLEGAYLCRTFSYARSAPVRAFYRALYPVARGTIAKANGADDPANVARAFERSERALDFVEKHVNASGQLVGDRFSAADLTCAALLAPLTSPPCPDMRKPEPMPESMRAFLARFAQRPAIAWVNRQYELHRPPSAAVR
jgi:glutathione S-transferase